MIMPGFEHEAVMSLLHCIYASTAAAAFRESQIPALLERTRTKNAALGITGMLLFIEGSFFQVLEGDARAVDGLYAAIGADPRHRRITQIIREPIARRSFEEWSMGFASLDRAEAARLINENNLFRSAYCLERVDAGRAKKLLVAFGKGRWRTDNTGLHRAHPRVG
jgi:hypothetical protein